MLTEFSRPKTVTCILCRGSVSVRRGDKTRFFSHISHDHEVHHDLELLFALSYINDKEKGSLITAMKTRFEQKSPAIPLASQTTKTVAPPDPPVPPTLEETSEEPLEETNSTTKDEVETKENDEPKPEGSPKVKCTKCNAMVSQMALKIHMKVKHKVIWSNARVNKTRTEICNYCEKAILKNNMRRHVKRVHKVSIKKEVRTDNPETDLSIDPESVRSIKKEIIANGEEEVPKSTQGEDKASDVTMNEDTEKSQVEYKNCKICFKPIKKSYYQAHLRDFHTGKRRIFTCHLCYFVSKRKEHRDKHFLVHGDDVKLLDEEFKPTFSKDDCKHSCNSCSKKFITEDCVKVHEKRKHGLGQLKCDKCERKFRENYQLKAHLEKCTVLNSQIA